MAESVDHVSKTSQSGDSYEDKFEPEEYLTQYYNEPGTPQNYYRDVRLKLVHEIFETVPREGGKNGFKILDYGSGPVIAHAISSAGNERVSEIVLAEFTEKNRNSLSKWRVNDPLAFNWLPYIKYVVQDLEKKSESEVYLREERLRSLIKVVSCDIKAKRPIEKGFEGPYDVVMTFLAIECACQNEADYIEFMRKLSSLVKPDGTLVMFTKMAQKAQSISYKICGQKFYYYTATYDMLLNALSKAGFGEIHCTKVRILEAISKLTPSEIAKLEANPCSDDNFYYMTVTAVKKN